MRLRYAGITKAIMMAKFPLLHHHTHRGAWHGMAKETRQREDGGGGSANNEPRTNRSRNIQLTTYIHITFRA